MLKPTFNAYRTFILISRLMKDGQVTLQELDDEVLITFTNRQGKYFEGRGTHICTAFNELQKVLPQ